MSAPPFMEHPGGGPSLSAMLFLSFGVHLLLLVVLMTLPTLPAPKLTLGPIYSVELVAAPPEAPSATVPSALDSEWLNAGTDRHAAVFKKAPPLAPVPERRPEQVRKPDAAEAAVERIRRQVASAPTAAPAPRVSSETPTPAGGGGSEAERRLKARRYVEQIDRLVQSQWAFPRDIPLPADIEAVVHVTVLANGTVTGLGFEKRSGNRYFDESVLKAVRKASPFPPLPEGLGGGRLEIGIRFHPGGLR